MSKVEAEKYRYRNLDEYWVKRFDHFSDLHQLELQIKLWRPLSLQVSRVKYCIYSNNCRGAY